MPLIPDLPYCCTILPHYLYHRLVTGKYGPDVTEKLGHLPSTLEPEGKRLWVHAVSVGEAEASRTLISGFESNHPDWSVRVSTTTATGREVATKRFGKDRVFYYPLDLSWIVRRSFDRIQPSLIVLMELEIWPNFLAEAERRKVPVVVSNVRITDRSIRRFRQFSRFARPMLNRVNLWLSQSEEYADRLREIGVSQERITVVGSLKYDTVQTDLSAEMRAKFRHLVGAKDGDFVIIAGSTHPGEEEPILKAYKEVRERSDKRVILVLVPRHPERAPLIFPECTRIAESVLRSNLTDDTSPTADIILVDTIGELGSLYAASDLVIMGGTFSESVGGHNMLEPCGIERPAVVGPHTHNFLQPMQLLRQAQGVREISDVSELSRVLSELLQQPDVCKEMGERARSAILREQGATERSLRLIEQQLL